MKAVNTRAATVVQREYAPDREAQLQALMRVLNLGDATQAGSQTTARRQRPRNRSSTSPPNL